MATLAAKEDLFSLNFNLPHGFTRLQVTAEEGLDWRGRYRFRVGQAPTRAGPRRPPWSPAS